MDSNQQQAELWVVNLQEQHGFDDATLNECLQAIRDGQGGDGVLGILEEKGYEV